MHPTPLAVTRTCLLPSARRLLRSLALLLSLTLLIPSALRAAETGTISGAVSNAASGNMLEGARIELPTLKISTLTDNTGRYTLPNVPVGAHEIVISYIGLDASRGVVNVTAAARATRDAELTTGIYKLETFKVTGEREGNAAMITEKRNADNVKDVIAMDSFGNLPNMSAGEVVMRLPGVAGSPTDEGLAYRFNMRGMDPTLNNVTVDGQSMTTLGTNRSFELQSITGTMFDALELIKGHTPDKGADSLGGTVNFKTRSTFSMRENRRTNYNFSMRYAPPFFEQTPMRSQHRAHPILNVSHQEVFSVFGESRNLGVSANLFWSENAVGGFANIFDYTNLINGPAPVWDYQTWDNINNRKQMSLNLKADYRWSQYTKFSLGVTGNDNFERMRRRVTVRAFTGGNTTVPNATTTGVVAGAFNDYITVVRPVTAAQIDVTMDGPLNYYVRMRRLDASGEHNYGRLLIEYAGSLATTHLNSGNGKGGTLNMRNGSVNPATGLFVYGGSGWILDRSQDAQHPRFLANGGPDFNDPANYRPRPTDGLVQNRAENDQFLKQFRFDMRYTVPIATPLNLKTGFHWRELNMDSATLDNHRWAYAPGGPALPNDPTYVSYDRIKTGRAIPVWQSHMFTTDGRPTNKALWVEDLYFNQQQKYTGTRWLSEEIPAYYFMAQGRLGTEGLLARTGYLGGMRFETTKTNARGWVRGRVLSTAAQQALDPIGWADRDYANNYRENPGKYTKSFPSIHAFHDLTKDIKLRTSYSTSYGRPPIANLLPGETPSEATQTVTVNNPGLGPYTATNWDATIEYYFEPVGSLTVGWFHKDIRDFIITSDVGTIADGPDNGYGGQYSGWTERTNINGGNAIAQGWEFAYQQQFTFLPGPLKGLSGSFNYTWITTHGTRDGTRYLTRREVAGFIPHAANARLAWRYRKFNTQILYNFTGEHITTFNATNPGLNQYRFSMKTVNVGFGYQARPWLNFSFDVSNILNEPQQFYIGYKHRVRREIVNFVTLTAGVNGRF
ncbi:TonB-dependent receptor [Horticoccus sp. 23ND18S-11]|uniref:TonB-dependent receptor n=1 Tax=Horticoccus sp. 23ND18S-11 TaxID=3391832 RepID=UPI0039C90B4C